MAGRVAFDDGEAAVVDGFRLRCKRGALKEGTTPPRGPHRAIAATAFSTATVTRAVRKEVTSMFFRGVRASERLTLTSPSCLAQRRIAASGAWHDP